MFTLKDLDYLLDTKQIPNENEISLELYLDYYETYIKNQDIEVELNDGSVIYVRVEPNQVSHILDLHQFYDSSLKSKYLRFPGAFAKIDGVRNIRNKVITLDTLRKANKGKTWKNDQTRFRVLCFPYILKALLDGTWYLFDINKYGKETELIPDIIVDYKLKSIHLNFCLSKLEGKNDYYCISNLVTYKTSNRIINQDQVEIDRLIHYNKKTKLVDNIRCHNRLYRNNLRNAKYTEEVTINNLILDKLVDKKLFFNSYRTSNQTSKLIYLKIDGSVKKIITNATLSRDA